MQPLDPAAPRARRRRRSCRLLEPIMPEKNRKEFTERHDTDFAYEIPGLARFRAQRVHRPQGARRGVPRHPDARS